MRTPSRRLFLMGLTVLLLAVPAMAAATHYFADVADDSTHAQGIEYVAEMGIASGCGDGTRFCPRDNLTRGQMATFLLRSSGWDDAVPPSVNALNTSLVNFQLKFTGFEDFTLTGGTPAECAPAEPFGGPMDFLQVQHQLTASPATQNALVNLALNIDRSNTNGEYQVCFARVDGQNLDAGVYETSFAVSIDLFGDEVFEAAGAPPAGDDEATARAMMAAKLGR